MTRCFMFLSALSNLSRHPGCTQWRCPEGYVVTVQHRAEIGSKGSSNHPRLRKPRVTDLISNTASSIVRGMAPASCALCQQAKAILKRPKTGQQICKECFFFVFETEVHHTITEAKLFKPGDKVAIGASGGKGMCCLCLCMIKALLMSDIRLHGARICHEDIERPI